jgi:putative pyrroloquinoline-quinone binding quinoprotein
VSVLVSAGTGSATVPGHRLWTRRFLSPTETSEYADVVVDPSGTRVFVTGSSGRSGHPDYRTVAYDAATGSELWARLYGTAEGIDVPVAIGVNPSGSRVFVTGVRSGVSTTNDYETLAYNAATGATLWKRRFDDGPYDQAASLVVSPGGRRVYVAGVSEILAYDASDGTRIWGEKTDSGYWIAVSPDGSELFAVGATFKVGSDADYLTTAYDTRTGRKLWRRTYSLRSQSYYGDFPWSVAASPDGKAVFITGRSVNRSDDSSRYATVAYDAATGKQLWVRRYGPNGEDDVAAYSVAVSPDSEEVVVTGYIGTVFGVAPTATLATVAYDAETGDRLWARRSEPPGKLAIGYEVAFSPNGALIFVTGSSRRSDSTSSESDFVTIAYDASDGTGSWSRRYRPGKAATDLAVGPRGNRIFTIGLTDHARLVTVAYAA